MDFAEWEDWSKQEVAFFISAYCELPQYAKCAERNLDGQELKKLSDYGRLLKGLTFAGIQDYGHQKSIASSVLRLQQSTPEELNKELEMKMHAASFRKKNSHTMSTSVLALASKTKKHRGAVPPMSMSWRSTPSPLFGESTTKKSMQRSQSDTTLSLPHRSVERLTPLPWRCLGGDPIGLRKTTSRESTPVVQAPSFPSKLRNKMAKTQAEYSQMKAADEGEMQAMKARERTTNMINQLKADVGRLDTLIPSLPAWLQKLFSNKNFDELCTGKFEQYDVDGTRELSCEAVFPLLMDLTCEQPVSLTMEHCVRFVQIFDTDNSGTLDIQEFRDFLRFSLAMAYLEAAAAGGGKGGEEMVDQIFQEAKEERNMRKSQMDAEKRLNYMIESMEAKGMTGLDAIMEDLPQWLQEDITKPEFKDNCEYHFKQLDEDGSEELSLEEIFPMLLELTREKPCHIDKRHCMRFISAFDKDGNGNLDLCEFTNFVRFAMAMCYLEGERLKEQQAAAQQRLQETMSKVNADMGNMQKTIEKMPPPIRKLMDNVENSQTFKDRWNALDADRSGTLEMQELFPLVEELCAGTGVEDAKLDPDQCAEFAKMFDENGDGVISKSEFADFIRFCLVMSYTDAQEEANAEVDAVAGELDRKSNFKKVSILQASEADLELFQMSAQDETKIAKIQAAYRGKQDRKAAAKKAKEKEQKELKEWTDDIGEDADVMARRLQHLHKKKQAKIDVQAKMGDTDDMQQQMRTLQKKKSEREAQKLKKRKSEAVQEHATGGVDTLFAALEDEELEHGPIEGDFDMSQLSEEHRAQLEMIQQANVSSAEVMEQKKAAAQRQRDQEKKWQEEQFNEKLKNWALSFGVEGDDAATKIQRYWSGGASKLMVLKAKEQVEIEQSFDLEHAHKKKHENDKLQKELKEWEASMDPKELNDAALKVQAATRRKNAKKEADEKRKHAHGHDHGHSHDGSPKSKQETRRYKEGEVDPTEFDNPECDAVATKLQAIQRGKIARKQTAELKMKSEKEKDLAKVDPTEFDNPECDAVATKLQAIQRGKIARKQTADLKKEKGLAKKKA